MIGHDTDTCIDCHDPETCIYCHQPVIAPWWLALFGGRFRCGLCFRGFTTREAWTAHDRAVHS